jgi:hypothetical protein
MKKKFLTLCLLLIVPTLSSLGDTLKITSEQLKTTNLIFAEHKKFSEQIPLLEQQIINLKQIDESWKRTDSIRKSQLYYYNLVIEDKNKSIEGLNKSLKRRKNTIKYGAAVSVLTIVLCLFLK